MKLKSQKKAKKYARILSRFNRRYGGGNPAVSRLNKGRLI